MQSTPACSIHETLWRAYYTSRTPLASDFSQFFSGAGQALAEGRGSGKVIRDTRQPIAPGPLVVCLITTDTLRF
jgi:hypothetical protein